jgi:hypothetical protein
MKNLKYILVAFIAPLFVACGSGSYDYEDDYLDDYVSTTSIHVDNGADTNVFVTLTALENDSTFEIEVGSYEVKDLSLPYGKYNVTAITSLDSVIIDNEEIFLDESDYHYSFNLNLTKQDYIKESIKYTVGTDFSAGQSEFTYDGETYEGVDASVIKGKLLVPSDWDYNLDEEAPEEVSVYEGQSSATKTKLYRASTFILYLTLYEMFGDYDEEGEESSEDLPW